MNLVVCMHACNYISLEQLYTQRHKVAPTALLQDMTDMQTEGKLNDAGNGKS